MRRNSRSGTLLFIWGLMILIGSGVLYYPGDRTGVGAGLRWLTLLVAFVLGGGFLWHSIRSWQGEEDQHQQGQRPALILGIIGLLTMITSVPIFRPWAFEGLAAGLRVFAICAFLIGGGLCVAIGVYCHRRQNQKVPMTIFAGLTGTGVYYQLNNSGFTNGLHPVLWLLVIVLFVGGPALAIYYRWPYISNPPSFSDG